MNLFRQYINSKPVRASLSFGHNVNIIIANIDFEERKSKETVVNANTFITLHQVDPVTRAVKARFEGSFWNLDHASDFVVSQFVDHLTVFSSILEAVGADVEQFAEDFLDASGIDGEVTKNDVNTKAGAKKVQDALVNAFKKAITDKIGDNCPLLQCKLVSNKKGYLEFAKQEGWILPMDSTESLPEVTKHELDIFNNAQNATKPSQVEPDQVGKAPEMGEAKVSSPATFDSL